ncbi:MAG TPA: ABC transporter substrate-binding protein [Erysipelotrichaceae bacterium]|nr:ABC transporter substrate-binding protein [Erysipelotrichaceae bacterium]
MFKRLTILFLVLGLLTACQSAVQVEDKPQIMVSLFPQYDIIRQIAQDKVDVELFLPVGSEPHNYEPSASTLMKIMEADLFIYSSDELEPWVNQLVEGNASDDLIVLDASNGITLLEADHGHEEEEEEEVELDPHYWLDPLNMIIMSESILNALIEIDPENEGFYRDNAKSYISSLNELDAKWLDLFEHARLNQIIYGGHFAFGYLSNRFGLDILSPYSGYAPDAEPSAQALAGLMDVLAEKEINVIFYEELIDPRVARIIAEQAKVKIEVLHGAHNLNSEEMQAGWTYISIMEDNIAKLKEALRYE